MKEVKVGISSIGSGIGQSVVNALNLSTYVVHTVGFGNAPFEYGALDCDHHYQVPAIKDPEYIDSLIDKCLKEGIDILIPGLDDDVLILSEAENTFREAEVELLAAPQEVVSLCRDKLKLSKYLQKRSDVFVKSYRVGEIREAFIQEMGGFPLMAKPRGGSGSRGVRLITTEKDLEDLSEDYLLQPLLRPASEDNYAGKFQDEINKGSVPQVSELSVQVIIGRDGNVLGKLATLNRLKQGVPIEIFPVDREEIWTAVDQVLGPLMARGLRGPVNIQGRITGQGVFFFEVNPRFTGLTGLRAQLGFNGAEACVKSWLNLPEPGSALRMDSQKFGLRQVADRVIALERHHEGREYHRRLNGGSRHKRKVLLITGSTGYLGRNLIPALTAGDYRIWALSTHPGRASKLFRDQVDEIFTEDAFQQGGLPWGRVDLLLHAGFARPYRPEGEIARSLEFTRDLFYYAGTHMVPALVYISSQSIYGQGSPPPWDEESPPAPRSSYAAAKYAAELMLRAERLRQPHLNWTSLRLAGLTGGAPGLVPVDLVTRFVERALKGEPLVILGEHSFERLDIRDAVQGLIRLMKSASNRWGPVYNMGRGRTFTIQKVAYKVIDQVKLIAGGTRSEVITRIQDPPLAFGMDSSEFFQLTGWQPQYTLEDSIQSLIAYLQKQRETQQEQVSYEGN